jgi:hypothetical protein
MAAGEEAVTDAQTGAVGTQQQRKMGVVVDRGSMVEGNHSVALRGIA